MKTVSMETAGGQIPAVRIPMTHRITLTSAVNIKIHKIAESHMTGHMTAQTGQIRPQQVTFLTRQTKNIIRKTKNRVRHLKVTLN